MAQGYVATIGGTYHPRALKENLHANQQEEAQKAVERVFGVLLGVSKSFVSFLDFGMLKVWSSS
jgi:hypothetical protein